MAARFRSRATSPRPWILAGSSGGRDVAGERRRQPFRPALVLRVGLFLALRLPRWIEVVRIVVVNALFLRQHANVRCPRSLEALRVVFVTPSVHRQHHSPVARLIDRNLGQLFSFWDRLFRAYAEPAADAPPEHALRKLGGQPWQTLAGVLLTPLRARAISGPL